MDPLKSQLYLVVCQYFMLNQSIADQKLSGIVMHSEVVDLLFLVHDTDLQLSINHPLVYALSFYTATI